MRYAVIYDSPSGNTKRLADEIKEYMDEQNGSPEECIFFGEPEPDDRKTERISGAEIVFAGFWTDKGDCSEKMKGFLCVDLKMCYICTVNKEKCAINRRNS